MSMRGFCDMCFDMRTRLGTCQFTTSPHCRRCCERDRAGDSWTPLPKPKPDAARKGRGA